MNLQNLKRANEIKKEIDKIEDFLLSAKKVWTGKIIKQDTKYIFKSNAFGVIDSEEFELNTEMKNKMISILEQHLEELKKELESL